MKNNQNTWRELYDQMRDNPQGVFPSERPAIFAPAASAQDPANNSSLYFRWTPIFVPYEFTNWVEESRAHVESCYIGDWSAISKIIVTGPDALRFPAHTGTNDLSKFEVGQIKHHVQLSEQGYVASEGIVYRMSDTEIFYSGGGADWTAWQLTQGSWDAKIQDVTIERFIFEVQGPTSLHALEAATGHSLRDIRFNRGRAATLAGVPVHILRTGISGELGYEVHGPSEEAGRIWDAIVQAGVPHAIRQLGMRAQLVQHIEAGIATAGIDYLPASIGTPGMQKLIPSGVPSGSFIPSNGLVDLFRYPAELGWGNRTALSAHDFIGREALLELEARGGPPRTLVSLIWDSEDVQSLFAAQFDASGELPEPMQMPRVIGGSYDVVRVDGRDVGVSTSRTYSANLRKTISLCVIDRAYAEPGTDVSVLWGSPGTPQRELRAKVAATPLKPDRRRTDVLSL